MKHRDLVTHHVKLYEHIVQQMNPNESFMEFSERVDEVSTQIRSLHYSNEVKKNLKEQQEDHE